VREGGLVVVVMMMMTTTKAVNWNNLKIIQKMSEQHTWNT